MKFINAWFIPAALALVPAGFASGQEHGDVAPRVSGGQIVTDEYVDGSQTLTPNVRVFGYDFRETVEDPYLINDPGINALDGSGLPAGSRMGVEPAALPASAGGVTGLAYWDGVTTTAGGDPAFGAAPQGESLTVNFGSQNRTLSSNGAVPGGFFFGPAVGAGGTFHDHLTSILNDGPGGTGTVPQDGIYVIALRLTSDSPLAQASAPAYFVFNNGLTEAQHDDGINFVAANVVPEPAGASLLALAAALPLLKRGRRASA